MALGGVATGIMKAMEAPTATGMASRRGSRESWSTARSRGAWRWRPAHTESSWVYDPEVEWLDRQGDAIERCPLYAAPVPTEAEREEARDAARFRAWRDLTVRDNNGNVTDAEIDAVMRVVDARTYFDCDASIDAAIDAAQKEEK